MTTYRPCAEEVCGNIVDINHKTKIVRLTLLQLLVDQSLHKAWHLDRAWHWALGRGPFLSPDKFDCSAHSHFTNSVATKTQYPHTNLAAELLQIHHCMVMHHSLVAGISKQGALPARLKIAESQYAQPVHTERPAEKPGGEISEEPN
jgi:hypothetical protein